MVDVGACLAGIAADDAAIAHHIARRHQRIRDLVDAFGADVAELELRCLLTRTARGAERLICEAEALRHVPRVQALLNAGLIDDYRAWIIASELSQVLQPEDPRWAAVEATVCEQAPGLTSFRLKRLVLKHLIAVDPDAARKRHAKAKRGRQVRSAPDTDGMVVILARLAAADATMIMLTLDAMADAAPKGDPRTRDQLRADALSELFKALIEGRPLPLIPLPRSHPAEPVEPSDDDVPEGLVQSLPVPDAGQSRPLSWRQRQAWRRDRRLRGRDAFDDGEQPWHHGADRARVQALPDPGPMPTPSEPPSITPRCIPDVFCPPVLPTRQGAPVRLVLHADASTVTGGNDLPGDLAGHGAITAEAVRDLAKQVARVDLVVRDQQHPGHLATANVYRPPLDLRRRIVARDGTCRGPGCRRAAEQCDLDHAEPFDHQDPGRGGPTCDCNLIALCRHCHVLKTDGVITPALHDDGSITWRTANGQTVTVPPPDDPRDLEEAYPETG